MRFFLSLLLLFVLTPDTSTQELNYAWHFTAGGPGQDEVLGSTIDHLGNSILVGNFEDSLAVDGLSYKAIDFATDGFILKLDPDGKLLWVKELNVGEFEDVYPFDVAVDEENNILVAGSFRGTLDADPSDEAFLLNSELDDIYLSKLDGDGNLLWAQTIRANNSEERILDVEIDEEGMLYLGGYIDITPEHNNDVPFLMKFNPADTAIEWNYAVASKGRIDGINELVVDGDHVYITGSFEGESIFGTDPSNPITLDAGAGKDMFVVKLTRDRELIWALNIGADQENNDVIGRSISVDSNGDLYIAGDYDGLIDFDPGAGVAELDGFINSFLLKLSENGDFQWVVNNKGLRGKKVIVNGADQPFVLFETSELDREGLEIKKVSNGGDTLWTNTIRASSIFDISMREMQFNADEDILIAVNFSGAFNYDPNPNSDVSVEPMDGENDFIYLKLNQDAVLPTNNQSLKNPAKFFPNPVSDFLSIEFDHSKTEIEVQILDVLGKQIFGQRFHNERLIKIPFNFRPGQYYLKYIIQGEEVIQKIQKG